MVEDIGAVSLRELFFDKEYDSYLELVLTHSPQMFYSLVMMLTLDLQVEKELKKHGNKFN